MANVIGVRFREAGKIYYFDAGGMLFDVGEYVVVETVRGIEVGRIVIAPDQVLANENREPLKPVIRAAEHADVEQMYANRQRAKADLEVVRAKISEHNLPMHVVGADYNLDRSQYTVYFTADERIDFRSLVRDASGMLNTRLQLLQVGDRDRAKLVGGVGRCGRHVCCNSWLTSFPSISIKMARSRTCR
jgi:cell fate regulator YaaT (PSP1 superfamily)